jgi:deoxyadenosine/deoxycytidine kinase
LKENIKKRNRPYEQSIERNYLFSIQETYIQYIKQHNIKTLFIDVSNADFLVNDEHLKIVLDALNHDYDSGQNYLILP